MVVTLIVTLALAALTAQQPETLSLLDEPLYPPPVSRAERGRLEEEAAQARGDIGRDPANADAALRLARAQRGLGHIGDALETLSRAIEGKADAPLLRLERGRGFLAIRKFDLAQREFRKAADALPEAHCGIAFSLYVAADYKQSSQEYGKCATAGVFGYLAARRAGEHTGARPQATDDTRMHGADIKLPGSVATPAPETASMAAAYMDAVDDLVGGRRTEAKDLLKRIVDKNKHAWMEPLYIAAEADYAAIVKAEPKKKKKKKLDD